MKRMNFILIMLAFLISACNSNQVKVRGEVEGLKGKVRLLAEMPGQDGLTVLAEQDVTDGQIDLRTEEFQIPGRVWVDIDGKSVVMSSIAQVAANTQISYLVTPFDPAVEPIL